MLKDLNYFTCTLGEAETSGCERPFQNVNYLIDQQSKNRPRLPAVGFYHVSVGTDEARIHHEIFTFRDVQQRVFAAAERLSEVISVEPGKTVGLLCSSSAEFLFTWLRCIRLGYPVLLIAPQCPPSGIVGLCDQTGVSCLLVDDKNEALGRDAVHQAIKTGQSTLQCVRIPTEGYNVLKPVETDKSKRVFSAEIKGTDIAYLHHTSGTSSGTPKPIPQSHRAAVGVLPALDGKDRATFTTTPLYHGGPADIFRAWASGAMIWLFPSKDLPITAANVIRCLDCSREAADQGLAPPVAYFASVPYVLQMTAADEKGLKWLQRADLVGVGGAALPRDIGDQLVNEDVNLVSRFGSAECGFLLSSNRYFCRDKAWQYLRVPQASSQLSFEPREGNLAELVVVSGWPHMSKTNREDGSFATSDLFEAHSCIENAWRYHSRADAQLTLTTGKKFDPSPLEEALLASTKVISEAFVFGNDKPYPGVLLFRSQEAARLTDDDVLQEIVPVVERMNSESQSHSRLPKNMLLPLPYSQVPLEKSSKGTVIRNKAEQSYATVIDDAYGKLDRPLAEQCSDDELPGIIRGIILEVLGTSKDLAEDMDLFSFGVDSVAGMQIRHRLRQLLPSDAPALAVNIVEDCGTVKDLAAHTVRLRHGHAVHKHNTQIDETELMKQLVEGYSTFASPLGDSPAINGCRERSVDGETVLLTGATGALGAHVLDQLRNKPNISKIYCLVRGADEHAAYERVSKALEQRLLRPLTASNGPKVFVLQAQLSDHRLGLDERSYRQLAREVSIMLHLAWSVNFRMKLRSFVNDSIASVQNLINLALSSCRASCPRFAFCSSVASSMAYSGDRVPEALLNDPSASTDIGYSQSKWVAEQICGRASKYPRLRGKLSIFRVGQLSGDSINGVWNKKEAWPLLLSSTKLTGVLPDLGDEVLNWVPVNIAATVVIEGAMLPARRDRDLDVYHVLNDRERPYWTDMLNWLRKKSSFAVVNPVEWISQLEAAAERGEDHAALQLLDHWREAYKDRGTGGQQIHSPTFDMIRSKDLLPSLRDVGLVNDQYFYKLWTWIEANM